MFDNFISVRGIDLLTYPYTSINTDLIVNTWNPHVDSACYVETKNQSVFGEWGETPSELVSRPLINASVCSSRPFDSLTELVSLIF